MKILIISYLFAPNNNIGAVRPSKIAGMLAHRGYTVDVISYGMKGNDSFPLPDNIRKHYMMNNQQFFVTSKCDGGKISRKRSNAIVRSAKQHYRTNLLLKNGKKFVNFCIKLYKEKLIDQQYDVLITSFGPPASLQCGLKIKKLSPHIKWLCDFRDPVVTEDSPLLYLPYYQYLQNKACRKADRIIAVSNGYVKRICGKKYVGKAYMIPNGYDDSDIKCYENIFNDGKLHLVYVGSLYEGKRKISPLFRAVSELIKERVIDKNKLSFDYAGGDYYYFLRQAEEYAVDSLVNNHGILSRQDCLKLQSSSDILILSTWNNKGEEGVFPGKFLEYMLIRKPIISITDGNLSNGEISTVMREGNFGLAYEAINDKEDYIELKKYLKKCYLEACENCNITYNPVQSVLDRYNYKCIIEKLEKVINE